MTKPDDRLDELLSAWSKRQEPSPERLESLVRSVRRQLAETGFTEVRHSRGLPHRLARHWTVVWIPSLAVAAALVAAMLVGWSNDRNGQRVNAVDSKAAVASTARNSVDSVLLSALEELFADRLAWVAVTDDAVSLGIDDTPVGPAAGNSLNVHLTIDERAPGTSQWRTTWTVNVKTRIGERVHFVQESSTVNLWTCLLPDGNVAVEGCVALTSPFDVLARIDEVGTPGVAKEIYTVQASGRDYRLMQSFTSVGG